jgi:hypothetical protein
MRKLKPEFLKKKGRAEFVVLTIEDFRAFEELIEDARDVLLVRQARAKNGNDPGIPLEEMMRRLGMKPSRRAKAS